jgi:hypothetical protein
MTPTLAWLVPALPLAFVASTSEAHAQGLEPPPPMGQTAPGYPSSGSSASNASASDESEDSGLGLEWVYLNAEAGASYVDMQSFSASSFGLVKTSSGGPAFGFGAGVRLLFFTLGLRARDLSLSDIGNLWLLNLEAAFHTRIWRIDPYFGVRGGYNFVGSLDSNTVGAAVGSTNGVSVHGFNVGPMAGIDVYLAHAFSIGADIDAQFLFISRPQVALPAGVTEAQAVAKLPAQYQGQAQALYGNSGSSAGIQITPTIHLGVHF